MKLFPLILVGLLVVVIGSGIFLLTAGKNIGQFLFGKSYAEGELKEYVASVLKDEVNGVSCQTYDTDNNGYVSCDYTTTKQPEVTRSLECAAWGIGGFLNRGCKTRLPNFQTN
ncbi:MAG: hypothetical protein WCA35_02095 [Kovacikia sp.]